MDDEADLGDGPLSAEIGIRRRSASVSDDYSVQKTNDDATESKYAAVKLNYWYDNFIDHFVHGVHKRDPEISCGYWARVATVNSFAQQFIEMNNSKCQIISLGAGFDTLFWRLKENKFKVHRFVEIDFSSVTSKKIRHIRKPQGDPKLFSFFDGEPKESQHSDLHAGDYHLIGADLRQLEELEQKLNSIEIDYKLPTLVISECVLIYMSTESSSALLKFFSQKFETIGFLNYEQVNTADKFGEVMLSNLKSRGIMLPGLSVCDDIETQKRRFAENGFEKVNAWTVLEIYRNHFSPEEVKRVEDIERLDEKELLTQLLEHYCFVYAFKGSSGSSHLSSIKAK
uniref:Leucine carboxyl methyltransferase 1 n=1 Tax=Panagrolaimus sp. ES5 TaxID=591445 RepID=A0AC34FQX9_9BILA